MTINIDKLSVISLLFTLALAIDTSCNPLKSSNCPSNPALATSFAEDFHTNSSYFTDLNHPGSVSYDSTNGLSMTLTKQGDNPTLLSNFYLMYGKVEVTIKCAPGRGIVSSFYLQSDDLDEIDLEWIGSDDTQFQSNFFSKGDVTTYDRGEFHGVQTPAAEFHTYSIDWAMDKTTWSLDGNIVRTLTNDTVEGYPQSPMYIKLGTWAGGDPANEPGTIEWAGGLTDYSQGPFTMYVTNVKVADYSTGKSYSYGDQSGSWESIVVEDGKIYGRYDEAQGDFNNLKSGSVFSAADIESSASASTSTKAASSSTSASSKSTSTAISSKTTSTVGSSKVTSTAVSSKVTSSTNEISSSATETISTKKSTRKSSTSSTSHDLTKKTSSKTSSTDESSSTSVKVSSTKTVKTPTLTSSKALTSSSKAIVSTKKTIEETVSKKEPSTLETSIKTKSTTTQHTKNVESSRSVSEDSGSSTGTTNSDSSTSTTASINSKDMGNKFSNFSSIMISTILLVLNILI